MEAMFSDTNPAVTAIVLAVAMTIAWLGAHVWERRRDKPAERGREPGKFPDAVTALLGLLLAFTFSMSLTRHEQRRLSAVIDSNSIGDFYTCVSLLNDPQRSELQAVLRRYAEQRLALSQSKPTEADLQQGLDKIRAMHAEMQEHVKTAVDGGTPVVVPLVNTLNALTSSHALRLSSLRDRLPLSIVWLLIVAAVLTMMILGRRQALSGEHQFGATIGFTVLVCMVFWVTLDLNQPQQGWIKVSQEPLEQLLKSMGP